MRMFGVSDATRIYACCQDAEVKRHRLCCPALTAYSRALGRLLRHLGEAADDEYWRGFLRFFRLSRFRLSAAPLPLDHPFEDLTSSLARVETTAAQCDMVFPSSGEFARALLGEYRALIELRENPILDAIREFCVQQSSGSTALLVREAGLVADTEALTRAERKIRQLEVIVPSLLRGAVCYDRLLVVGPSAWFPEFVFTSPRAKEIHLLYFDWVRDTWRPRPLLIGGRRGRTVRIEPTVEENDTGLRLEDLVGADEIIPETDWAAMIGRQERHESAEHDGDEADARLCALEGGAFTFLDASADARALVIDLSGQPEEEDDDEPSVVKRVPVSAVVPGMFVILRTRGGGDYIVPMADRLLGQRAEPYREAQRLWKGRLREMVSRDGMDIGCGALARLGARLASEGNVRNWMFERSIRPYYDGDFGAILSLVGLGNEAAQYFEAAAAIENAHRSAGLRIRQALMRRLLASDLRELERRGRMDLDLGEQGAGMLSALRVRDIRPELCRVPTGRLGRLAEERL